MRREMSVMLTAVLVAALMAVPVSVAVFAAEGAGGDSENLSELTLGKGASRDVYIGINEQEFVRYDYEVIWYAFAANDLSGAKEHGCVEGDKLGTTTKIGARPASMQIPMG